MTRFQRLCLVALGLAAGGCRETVARVVSKAHVYATSRSCPGAMIAVGDSVQFRASVMISNSSGGMSGPFDNTTLYTSEDNPGAFRWSLEYPKPTASEGAAKANITVTGLLIAKDTGVLYVNARSAGKNAGRIAMQVVPRVTRFALVPHDTAVQVGDTVFLRADAELERETRPVFTFLWPTVFARAESTLVERVETDPDKHIHRDPRENPLVAIRPGTLKVPACFAGARRDTATIRISGEAFVANRDVPPTVRLAPAETTVYVGEEFHTRVRVLNARLRNGPYRWLATTGDGVSYTDSSEASTVMSAFGFDASAINNHRYFTPGRYPVLVTVTDGAGRSTRISTTYTAVVREFQMKVLLPEGQKAVRLSGTDSNIAVAMLANKAKGLYPQHVAGAFVLTRMSGTPPLLFGRTAFDPEPNGWRRVTKDVNGDGEPDDVFYLDKATLRRNANLHVGRNVLVVTGVIGQRIRRPESSQAAAEFWPPIRGVVEFEVIP